MTLAFWLIFTGWLLNLLSIIAAEKESGYISLLTFLSALTLYALGITVWIGS